jgi:DNA helicase-2/ATP-dependent DNA helicase PcrA
MPEGDSRGFANGKGRRTLPAYQERLKTLNAVDFGDLLLPIRMFRDNEDVLAEYQKKFRYILVDEYQDTNTAQYLWLRLLAQRPAASGPTSAASATTTSRSMAGAAPRSTTSCASRRTSPAPRHPAGAQLPLHRTSSVPPAT